MIDHYDIMIDHSLGISSWSEVDVVFCLPGASQQEHFLKVRFYLKCLTHMALFNYPNNLWFISLRDVNHHLRDELAKAQNNQGIGQRSF